MCPFGAFLVIVTWFWTPLLHLWSMWAHIKWGFILLVSALFPRRRITATEFFMWIPIPRWVQTSGAVGGRRFLKTWSSCWYPTRFSTSLIPAPPMIHLRDRGWGTEIYVLCPQPHLGSLWRIWVLSLSLLIHGICVGAYNVSHMPCSCALYQCLSWPSL